MPTTTTTISRQQLAYPDQGHDGGALLHSRVTTVLTTIADNANSRYAEYTGIADSGVVELDHNFGANLAELHVFIYSGSGTSKQILTDPTSTANGYTIGEKSGDEETIIEVTAPGSGGPHSFTVVAVDGKLTPAQVHQLLEAAPSTPLAGRITTYYDSNGRALTKSSLGAIGTGQSLTPIHVSSSTFNALPGYHYICDSTSNTITATMPSTIADHDVVQFSDSKKTFNSNNLTLDRNGNSIDSDAADLVLNVAGDGALLVGDNAASNWVRASSGGAGGSSESGINYFENGSFENDATTGVSATNITAAAEEAAPLIGTRSSKLTSTASVGEVDYTITGIDNHVIDGEYILSVSGRYETDSAISLGDWTLGIYNVTDAVYATEELDLLVDSSDRFELGFVPLSGKTYVLRVEFTDTTAGRILLLDQLKCANEPLPSSPIVGPLEHFTPSYSNTGGGAPVQINSGQMQRIGDTLHVMLTTRWDGSGTGASQVSLDMPTYQGETITFPTNTGNLLSMNMLNDNVSDEDRVIHGETTSGSASIDLVGDGNADVIGSQLPDTRWSLQFMVKAEQWAGDGLTVTPNLKPAQTKIVDDTVLGITFSTGGTLNGVRGRAFRDSAGAYWLECVGRKTSGSSATGHTGTITGITFLNDGSTINGGASCFSNAATTTTRAGVLKNTADFECVYSASTTDVYFMISAPLDGKPTWWTDNVEASSVSTVIEEASAVKTGLVKKPQILFKTSSSSYSTNTTDVLQITNLPAGRYRVHIGARGFTSATTTFGRAVITPRINDTDVTYPAGPNIQPGAGNTSSTTLTTFGLTWMFTAPNATNTFDLDLTIDASSSVERPFYILERLDDSHVEVTTEWD